MPKKVDKEERKELIMNSALAVFAREGYREANLSLIAEESGISRPTVYQYFNDKNDIYYYAVKLVTGKTHQIRAHLAHVGHPIVGDGKYGDFKFNEESGEKVQHLTATELTLYFSKDTPLYYLNGKTFNCKTEI